MMHTTRKRKGVTDPHTVMEVEGRQCSVACTIDWDCSSITVTQFSDMAQVGAGSCVPYCTLGSVALGV